MVINPQGRAGEDRPGCLQRRKPGWMIPSETNSNRSVRIIRRSPPARLASRLLSCAQQTDQALEIEASIVGDQILLLAAVVVIHIYGNFTI
jgi:hypothetical protein